MRSTERSTEKPKTEHPCQTSSSTQRTLMCYRPVSRKIAIFNAFLLIRWLHLLHLYHPPPFWGSRILEGMQRLYWKLHGFSQLVLQYACCLNWTLGRPWISWYSTSWWEFPTSWWDRPSYVMMRTSLGEVLLNDFLCVLQVTQQQ